MCFQLAGCALSSIPAHLSENRTRSIFLTGTKIRSSSSNFSWVYLYTFFLQSFSKLHSRSYPKHFSYTIRSLPHCDFIPSNTCCFSFCGNNQSWPWATFYWSSLLCVNLPWRDDRAAIDDFSQHPHFWSLTLWIFSSHVGHVEVVRAIYPYKAQHVRWWFGTLASQNRPTPVWITFRDLKQSALGAVGLAGKVLFEKLCVALVRTSVLCVCERLWPCTQAANMICLHCMAEVCLCFGMQQGHSTFQFSSNMTLNGRWAWAVVSNLNVLY